MKGITSSAFIRYHGISKSYWKLSHRTYAQIIPSPFSQIQTWCWEELAHVRIRKVPQGILRYCSNSKTAVSSGFVDRWLRANCIFPPKYIYCQLCIRHSVSHCLRGTYPLSYYSITILFYPWESKELKGNREIVDRTTKINCHPCLAIRKINLN